MQFYIDYLHSTDHVAPSLDPTTGVASKDVTIDSTTSISARLFLPKTQQKPSSKLPILVYYHGGGFVGESPFSAPYHHYVNSLASQANVLALSVDYRLAPKHRLPAGYDDSWAALKWVASHADGGGPEPWLTSHGDFKRIFISGDSAGANICHQMAIRVWVDGLGFGIDKIQGAVLVHPFFWGSNPVGSDRWGPSDVEKMEDTWRFMCSRGVGLDDPWINPLSDTAPSLDGMACERVLVCVASEDGLVERGRAYYEALRKSRWDGKVGFVESEGEGHCFHIRKPECEKALELMKKVAAFVDGKEDEKMMGDGIFRRFFVWVLRGCLVRCKRVKIGDQTPGAF